MHRHRLETAYDRIAQEYAERNHMVPPLIQMGSRFLSRLRPGTRVLDVGCGDGLHMAWMEAQGFQVTGIDLSTGMLAQARARGVQGKLVQMDMCHLAFPPASFEGIWCCASLLHLPKAQAPMALDQLHRVLVPRGMLYLSIQEGEGEQWEVTRFAEVERFFARYTSQEAKALLSQAGFSLDECHRDEAGPRQWISFLAKVAE
ncbi:class I SAM-dependent methyltransferase [Ktedonosporobacter rubrisoli]|nr:class I SAM-dependent methyltransferase [Ktedonosporobacter rubrisoli]